MFVTLRGSARCRDSFGADCAGRGAERLEQGRQRFVRVGVHEVRFGGPLVSRPRRNARQFWLSSTRHDDLAMTGMGPAPLMKGGGLGFRSAVDEVPMYIRVSIFLAYSRGVNGSRKLHTFCNRKFLTWSLRSYPQTRCRGVELSGAVGKRVGAATAKSLAAATRLSTTGSRDRSCLCIG